MTDLVLECNDLAKSYGANAAVDGVSFNVAAGEVYGLLGPNGAGKSTLIYMLACVMSADRGTASVCGSPIGRRAVATRGHIGYVPQEVALWDGLTGRENLAFFGRLYGLRSKALRARVDETLAMVGLVERADDKLSHYSGGMKRRANIAAALLHEPRFIILDEPTVGVDPQSRNAILNRVGELARNGSAVLFASHYMDEMQRICDRVGVMDAGKLIAEGCVDELTNSVTTGSRAMLSANGDVDAALTLAKRIGAVGTARVTPDSRLEITAPDMSRAIADLVAETDRAGLHLTNIEIEQPSLESVFFSLTGKALRD